MADEKWEQIKEIFFDVVSKAPEERREFLDRVCSDDKKLRFEVESLLSSYNNAESFMESSVVGEVAEKILEGNHRFTGGQFLAHYEIVRQIGSGGMGAVYLATDGKLNRKVALKVLHRHLSPDKQGHARLLREAQAAATLDHPNICAIYEIREADDCSFIVMQYVEGETLAEILDRERLDVTRSLDLAIQIADAIAEAHAQRIIHRDIKPANIIINNKGRAKVLDFGLAKFIEAEKSEEMAKRLSSSGAIMGTLPYMSPEQLCGKPLDTCSDIFSFGAVFYEMISGIPPFQNDSNAEAISAILNDEPDWTCIPPELKSVVQKCLMKDKTKRYQTAKDLINDLRNIGVVSAKTNDNFFPNQSAPQKTPTPRYYFWKSSGSDDNVTPKTQEIRGQKNTQAEKLKPNYYAVFSIFAVMFLSIGAAVWLVWQFSKTGDSHLFDSLRPVRLVSWKSGANSFYSNYSSSHDGKMIAYSSTQDGGNETVFIKQTTDGEDFRVTKDEWKNHNPIWSPDDRRLAFASYREGQSGIYICPTLGGAATLLKVIGGDGLLFPRHWSKDGTAIFYEYDGNLFRLDIAAQESSQITNFTPSRNDTRYFSISPNETETTYCDDSDGQPDIWLMPLKDGTSRRLTNDKDKEFNPSWHPDGERILYNVFRDNHSQINLTDRNGQTPKQITRGDGQSEIIDVAADGTRIFYISWENKSDIWGVKIESGEEFELASAPEYEFWSDVSPDGKSIVYQTNTEPKPISLLSKSLIVIKSMTDKAVRFSLQGYNPRWLPESRHVAFLRWQTAEKKYNLWTVNTINGEEKQITDASVLQPATAPLPLNRAQTGEFSWSPDSTKTVFLSGTPRDVWLTSLESAETTNLTNNSKLQYYCPLWSPDGKRIAFVSEQKSAEKEQPSTWRIHIFEQGQTKEIFSTTESLRLLGWSASSGELIFETTVGLMKAGPLDVKLWQVSVKGENRIVGTFINIYAKSMSLSADGKTVAYTSRQDDKDNIFIAAANNGTAKKITANGNAYIFFGSLEWSPDGKTVFFDKQEEINTISMFENFK